MKQCDEDDDDD